MSLMTFRAQEPKIPQTLGTTGNMEAGGATMPASL
jgi:hypothetical protein